MATNSQLVIKIKDPATTQPTPVGSAFDMSEPPSWTSILQQKGASTHSLFNFPTDSPPSTDPMVEDMKRFLVVDTPEQTDESLEEFAKELRAHPQIEAAYVKPPGEPPVLPSVQSSTFQPTATPPRTPDFTSRQGYLSPAPEGVDAYYAWKFPGGDGANITIIDCEWNWNLNHEDLQRKKLGVVVGATSSDTRHGTAVLGEFHGDANGIGVVGISPEAAVGCAAFSGNTAQTIKDAADTLQAGDIILLEIHRPGPNSNGFGQHGYIAIEWWPDDFLAIRYATSKGIIVVEAAGNGAQDLDDPIYDQSRPGFPPTWQNPFNLSNPQSGAVIVGAGQPPDGTHGHSGYTDRARCDFSNYGSRIDCQGWGREVTTTGYGDLQSGTDRDYTDQFSGTSSASPIVVGAIACLQGALKASNQNLLTSATAAALLRKTGSPQVDELPGRPKTQRIGNRPDLVAMFNAYGFTLTP